MAEGRESDRGPRRGHDHVEDNVRPCPVEHIFEGTDSGALQTELGGTGPRPLDIDVHQANDRQTVDLARRFQPGATHSSAANKHCLEHF